MNPWGSPTGCPDEARGRKGQACPGRKAPHHPVCRSAPERARTGHQAEARSEALTAHRTRCERAYNRYGSLCQEGCVGSTFHPIQPVAPCSSRAPLFFAPQRHAAKAESPRVKHWATVELCGAPVIAGLEWLTLGRH